MFCHPFKDQVVIAAESELSAVFVPCEECWIVLAEGFGFRNCQGQWPTLSNKKGSPSAAAHAVLEVLGNTPALFQVQQGFCTHLSFRLRDKNIHTTQWIPAAIPLPRYSTTLSHGRIWQVHLRPVKVQSLLWLG